MSIDHPNSRLLVPLESDPVRRERMYAIKRAMQDSLTLAELRPSQGGPTGLRLRVPGHVFAHRARGRRVSLDPRSYAEALGGRLEVNVVFPEMTYTFVASNESLELQNPHNLSP